MKQTLVQQITRLQEEAAVFVSGLHHNGSRSAAMVIADLTPLKSMVATACAQQICDASATTARRR